MNYQLRKKIVSVFACVSAGILATAMVACSMNNWSATSGDVVDAAENTMVASTAINNADKLLGDKKFANNDTETGKPEIFDAYEVAYAGNLGYNYVEIEDEKGEIVDCYYVVRSIGRNESEDIVIPSTYKGVTVREIHPFAFKNNTKIKSVTIPESIEVIGRDAFKNCYNLEKVNMPRNLGIRKDERNNLLKGTIKEGAFAGCSSLKEITIPANVEAINADAFEMCSALEKVTFNNVAAIGKNAFGRCTSLTEIKIPSKVMAISDSAFYYCESLAQIDFGTNLQKIGKRAFAGCKALKSLRLPSKLVSIDKYAFAYCEGLESVEIPEKTAVIEEKVFAACTSLKKIDVASKNATFKAIDGNLYTKDGTKLLQYAIGKTEKEFTVEGTVKKIAPAAFSMDTSLTSIILKDGVEKIGEEAFYGCTNLANVTLSNTIKEIGEFAFGDCDGIESLVIPVPAVPDAPEGAELEELQKNGVKYYIYEPVEELKIYNYAFRHCNNLKTVYCKGDYAAWKLNVDFGLLTEVKDAEVYFYSEEEPAEEGNFWYYQDNKVTVWNAEVEALPAENA